MFHMETDAQLEQESFAAIGKTFRGEIWEDDAEVPMNKGYSNEGKPFDINTACYLKPVFRAIKNPNVRKFVAKAAVQTLKTFATVEKSASYFIKHDPGDMAIYDCDQESALDHAKSRLMPLLHSVPGIAGQIAEAENRHDITTTEFYLPGMTLRVWPLNLSSTQRITLKYVFISDAFQTKRTGMIEQAIARTTQHPKDKKIIIESQGSEEGDDFDQQWKSTDQATLHVICPLCGVGQPFEFERERPSDHPVEALRGKFSGFQRGPDELVLLPDGGYNAIEVMRNTYYECYHCGGHWKDNPETRAFLDESSYYVPQNPSANPENAGFSWPNWINQRVAWGGEDVMLGYLVAKKLLRDFGNSEKLKQWYQKRAARTWSEKLTQKQVSLITGSYDPSIAIPGEAARVMSVDCQQGDIPFKTGKFWYVARAIDKEGKMLYQLARGYAESWKDWIDVQRKLKIPNDNLAIDGGNYLHEVLDAAAANFQVGLREEIKNGRLTGKKIPYRLVWKVFIGHGTKRSFPHGENEFRFFSKPTFYYRTVKLPDGKSVNLRIDVFYWSNLSYKDQLQNLMVGGPALPKFLSLKREQLPESVQKKETGDLVYEKQMQNEYRGQERGVPKWIESSPNVHYRDCECGCEVLFDMGGFLGLPAAVGENGQEA
jgi:hypothetical protein